MSKFTLWFRQNSPAILTGCGILCSASSVVSGCIATSKLNSVTKPYKMRIGKIQNKLGQFEKGTPNYVENKKKLLKEYTKMSGKILLVYSPAVISFALSTACVISSHNIMKGRNIALASAFTTLKTGYDAYRERVRAKIGEEAEQLIYTDSEKVKIVTKDENGKKVTEEVTRCINPDQQPSDFGVWWGAGNWSYDSRADAYANAMTLEKAQDWFNQRLISRGYVFLDEIYDHLGIDPEFLTDRQLKATKVLGWIYIPEDNSRDNHISFGIHDSQGRETPQFKDFKAGRTDCIYLNFNVDADILTGDGGSTFVNAIRRKLRR